jgi:EpsI family protein
MTAGPTRRAIVLAAVLVAGFGLIFLLPESYGLRESAVIKAFPDALGEWRSVAQETPERVSEILGEQTFHKQVGFVRRADGGLYDHVSMFMVVSGNEMNASIHRPERCFPTQGITIIESSEVAIPVAGAPSPLEVTRLNSFLLTGEGERVPRLSYYWFVGSDQLTNSHYERTWIDIKDRVFKGSNQRWAYIMATVEYDTTPNRVRPIDEAEADKMLQSLLAELFPHVHKVDQLSG